MSEDHRPHESGRLWESTATKVCFLAWAGSVLFLYWLAHGPHGRLLQYPLIGWGHDFMLHYFKARYVF